MRLLQALFVLSFASFQHSAEFSNTEEGQLRYYENQVKILRGLLIRKCPEYADQPNDVQRMQLEALKVLTRLLGQTWIECRRKLQSSTPGTMSTTAQAPFCPSYDGDSVFNIQLVSYNNPTNKRASGVLCNPDGSPCSIFFDICISAINSSSCAISDQLTDVVGEGSKINLLKELDSSWNPLTIDIGSKKWQGVHVRVIAYHEEKDKTLSPFEEVDMFSYKLTDVQGSPHRRITLHGNRANDKTELAVMFEVPCPSTRFNLSPTPSTTLPTTPSTILPTTHSTILPTTHSTTISSPSPAECLTATNFTQSWRLDRGGENLRGGGPHSDQGYACDLRSEIQWFRFTGTAGTHMLETCPKWLSCGTAYPLWTDDKPPQAVGIKNLIKAYAVRADDCRVSTHKLKVMRCSLHGDHDLIYKYVGSYYDPCILAFCGQN